MTWQLLHRLEYRRKLINGWTVFRTGTRRGSTALYVVLSPGSLLLTLLEPDGSIRANA